MSIKQGSAGFVKPLDHERFVRLLQPFLDIPLNGTRSYIIFMTVNLKNGVITTMGQTGTVALGGLAYNTNTMNAVRWRVSFFLICCLFFLLAQGTAFKTSPMQYYTPLLAGDILSFPASRKARCMGLVLGSINLLILKYRLYYFDCHYRQKICSIFLDPLYLSAR